MIDKKSVKVLKKIKSNENITLEELKKMYGESIISTVKSLENKGLVINPTAGSIPVSNGFAKVKANKYIISPDGRAYLEEQRDIIIRYWIPILISYALSIISLVRTLWLFKLFAIVFPQVTDNIKPFFTLVFIMLAEFTKLRKT